MSVCATVTAAPLTEGPLPETGSDRTPGLTRQATRTPVPTLAGSATGTRSVAGCLTGSAPANAPAAGRSSTPTLRLVEPSGPARSAAPKWFVTVPELRKMIRMYTTEGATLQEIADELGRSIATVHRHLRRAGVELRPAGSTVRRHPRRLPDAELQRTARLYVEDGLSLRQVAEVLGVGQSSVRWRLERAGVQMRPKSQAGRESPFLRRLEPEVEDEIVRLYVEALRNQREIAEEIGVTRVTVQRVLSRRGVPGRDRAQATRVANGKPPGEPVPRVQQVKPKEAPTRRDYGAGRARRRVPAAPLVPLIEGSRDAEGSLEPFADAAGVSDRLLLAWRKGERRDASWDSADKVLIALDRFWWDVYEPADARPCETFSGVRGCDVVAWVRAAEMAAALWDAQPAVGERVKVNGNTWVIESWDRDRAAFWARRVMDGERATFTAAKLTEAMGA